MFSMSRSSTEPLLQRCNRCSWASWCLHSHWPCAKWVQREVVFSFPSLPSSCFFLLLYRLPLKVDDLGQDQRVTLLFLWKPRAHFVMSLLKSVALGLRLALDKEVVGSLASKPKGCQGRDDQTNVNCQSTCLNKDSRISPEGCWEKSWTIHILLWLFKPKFRARRQGEPGQLLLAWEKATQVRSIHLKPFLNQKGVRANWSVYRGHSVNQAGGACSLSSTIIAYLAKLSQDRPSDVVWATPLSSRKWEFYKAPWLLS